MRASRKRTQSISGCIFSYMQISYIFKKVITPLFTLPLPSQLFQSVCKILHCTPYTMQQMYVFLDILTMFTKSFINRSILGINQCRIPIQNRQCNEKTVDPFFELANYEFYYFFNVKTQPKINYKILFKFTLLIK